MISVVWKGDVTLPGCLQFNLYFFTLKIIFKTGSIFFLFVDRKGTK